MAIMKTKPKIIETLQKKNKITELPVDKTNLVIVRFVTLQNIMHSRRKRKIATKKTRMQH